MSGGGPPAEQPRHPRRARALHLLRRTAHEWSSDRVPDAAAAVAFYGVLSLLPAFLALAALLGTLDSVVGADVAEDVQDEVVSFLETVLTDEADGVLDVVRDLFEDDRTGLLTLSLAVAIWTTSRGFAALVRALDVVYDIDDRRGWLEVRLTGLAIALGSLLAAAVMLAVFVVGPLLGTGEHLAAEVGLGDQWAFAWNVLRVPLAFVVLVAWATVIFHVAPDHRTPWRWDLPGAVVTAILWALFSLGLGLYLELAQAGNAVFGALGGGLIALLWFWLLALAVLIGGELNQVLLADVAPPGSAGVERVAQAADERAGVDGGAAVEQDPHDGRRDDDPV